MQKILICDSHTCPVRHACRRNPDSNAPALPAGLARDLLVNPQYGGTGCEHYSPVDITEAA